MKKKKTKHIQVFLKGDNTCEVNAILIDHGVKDGMYHLNTKDIDGGAHWHYLFPLSELHMVRIYEC